MAPKTRPSSSPPGTSAQRSDRRGSCRRVAGIRNQVACDHHFRVLAAGGFIDALRDPQTIVIAPAAAADRTSFGLFKNESAAISRISGEARSIAMPCPPLTSLREAFDTAKAAIATSGSARARHPVQTSGPFRGQNGGQAGLDERTPTLNPAALGSTPHYRRP